MIVPNFNIQNGARPIPGVARGKITSARKEYKGRSRDKTLPDIAIYW